MLILFVVWPCFLPRFNLLKLEKTHCHRCVTTLMKYYTLQIKNHELAEKVTLVSQQRDEARAKVTDFDCKCQQQSEELRSLTMVS